MKPYANLRRSKVLRTLRSGRRWKLLFLMAVFAFIAAPIALAFVPWQQSVTGRGRVIAYDPTQRQQLVTARVGGNIAKWYVVEGSTVKPGDPIVDIEDNDPGRAARLDRMAKFQTDRLAQAREALAEQGKVVEGQRKAMAAALLAAEESKTAAEHAKTATEKQLLAAKTSLARDEELFAAAAKGLEDKVIAKVDFFRAKATRDNALAEVDRVAAAVEQAEAVVDERKAAILRADADGRNQIALAQRARAEAESAVFNIQRELEDLATQVERFKARHVTAPIAGTILRIEANAAQGGAYVKEGEPLAVIVPDSEAYVVELFIDGVDAPLIQRDAAGEYPHVRLQFEGWPAVQFVGWPSAAQGTFGGRVVQMDSHDDGQGRFRVLIAPDTTNPSDAWPDRRFLRQGNQAIGWVFLNRVTLGWEVWRRLNGFPPVLGKEAPEGDKDGKPGKPKIKLD